MQVANVGGSDAVAAELFIYYRVRAADEDALHAALRAMRTRLTGEHPTLRMRLLRRPDPDDEGLHTWMESYASDEGVTDSMRARIDALAMAGLQGLIQGARHTEVFVPCAW